MPGIFLNTAFLLALSVTYIDVAKIDISFLKFGGIIYIVAFYIIIEVFDLELFFRYFSIINFSD